MRSLIYISLLFLIGIYIAGNKPPAAFRPAPFDHQDVSQPSGKPHIVQGFQAPQNGPATRHTGLVVPPDYQEIQLLNAPPESSATLRTIQAIERVYQPAYEYTYWPPWDEIKAVQAQVPRAFHTPNQTMIVVPRISNGIEGESITAIETDTFVHIKVTHTLDDHYFVDSGIRWVFPKIDKPIYLEINEQPTQFYFQPHDKAKVGTAPTFR